MDQAVDVLIIGGGINGVGIACDAVTRGLSVVLCEKSDLAAETSSISSKLIHGGLRYLEQCHFTLVAQSLRERKRLLALLPHLVQPLKFILPVTGEGRSGFLLRLGLCLYDMISHGDGLPKHKKEIKKYGMKDIFKKKFSYYDCQADDSRLVVSVAKTAQQHGATILTRTRFVSAKRAGEFWHVLLDDVNANQTLHVYCKALINASGPWVGEIERMISGSDHSFPVKWVKGSHLVVKKWYQGEQAYLLQNVDGRVIFVMPYHKKYVLIGTTDVDYAGSLDSIAVSEQEVGYLLEIVARYFDVSLSADMIVSQFAGVRSLLKCSGTSLAKLSREAEIKLTDRDGCLPVCHVLGGKLTTYRDLSEKVLDQILPYFSHMQACQTQSLSLWGGDIPKGLTAFKKDLVKAYPYLPDELIDHYVYSYGSKVSIIFADVMTVDDLGIHFGGLLYEIEVNYLLQHEWAENVTDIIWRRTKFGLELTDRQIDSLDSYIQHALVVA